MAALAVSRSSTLAMELEGCGRSSFFGIRQHPLFVRSNVAFLLRSRRLLGQIRVSWFECRNCCIATGDEGFAVGDARMNLGSDGPVLGQDRVGSVLPDLEEGLV